MLRLILWSFVSSFASFFSECSGEISKQEIERYNSVPLVESHWKDLFFSDGAVSVSKIQHYMEVNLATNVIS